MSVGPIPFASAPDCEWLVCSELGIHCSVCIHPVTIQQSEQQLSSHLLIITVVTSLYVMTPPPPPPRSLHSYSILHQYQWSRLLAQVTHSDQCHSLESQDLSRLRYSLGSYSDIVRYRRHSSGSGGHNSHVSHVSHRHVGYDPRYHYKIVRSRRDKYDDIATNEFKRLGIGACFQGIDGHSSSTIPGPGLFYFIEYKMSFCLFRYVYGLLNTA